MYCCWHPPSPPVPPISSCSIFYFFLSPRYFIYSTNLFHPTGPCLKSLLPGMVYTAYGAVFPLFSVTSQRCTDSTSEAHLSCMRIFIKKTTTTTKTLVRGHLHSKQASKTLQLTVLKAQVWTVSSALYLFIFQLYSAREWSRYWIRINRSLPRMHTVNRLSPQADAQPLNTFAFEDN